MLTLAPPPAPAASNKLLGDLLPQTLEQAIEAVVVIDTDNRVILFNAAAESLWACPRHQVLGNSLDQLIPRAIRHEHDAYIAANRTTGINHIVGTSRDVEIERMDGKQRIGSMSISKVTLPDGIYYTAFIRDVTEQRRHEEQNRQQNRNRQLSLIVNSSSNAILVTGADGTAVFANPGFTRMFGYSESELIGKRPPELLSGPHTDQAMIRHSLAQVENGRDCTIEVLLYGKSGQPVWVSVAIDPYYDEYGHATHHLVVLTDITRTKVHEVLHRNVMDAIVQQQPLPGVMRMLCEEVEHILPDVAVSVFAVDADHRLRTLAAPSLPDNVLQAIDGIEIGPHAGSSGAAAWQRKPALFHSIATDAAWADYRALMLPHGFVASWSNPIISSTGQVLGTLSFYYRHPLQQPDDRQRRLADLCRHLCALALEREHARDQVIHLANFDTLTGLPNRSMLGAKAEALLKQATQAGSEMAVITLDLDRFKQINDTQGLAIGDDLLRRVARRLQRTLPPDTLICRQSGDEFVIILNDCNARQAAAKAKELISVVAIPLSTGEHIVHLSASIGIAIHPEHGHDIEALLRGADLAMYRAKDEGRATFRFYSNEMDRAAFDRVALESALREAIANQQLQLHYQPQMTATTPARLYGVEALLRWKHPVLGLVSPERAVSVAEESGLIADMSAQLLHQAIAQIADWRRRGIAVPHVAVNLSALNFLDPQLAPLVDRMLQQYALPPECLTLELTEQVMLHASPALQANIEAIHEMGVHLSLDDFGTGYSSLSHLHRLPADELKLDKSFVRDIIHDKDARTLTTSVLKLGESLKLTVVAEGVETEAQRAFLAEHGCGVLQGYLFSRAVPPAELEAWLQRNAATSG